MANNNIYKIFVNSNNIWEEIELDDLNLNTIFSVEEITDISKRKDTISKSLVLKGTKQNNKVFGALYSVDRDVAGEGVNPTNLLYNYKPNKYLDCFVLENNIEIIRGKLLISSIEVSKGIIFYNANIIGSVFSFFNNLSDRLLEELDSFNVSPYNSLRLDGTNIKNSWRANNFNTIYDDSNSKYPNLLRDSKMDRYEAYGSGGTWTGYDTDSTRAYRVTTFATAGQVFGIQSGALDRTLTVTQGKQYTLSFKMRGNIESLNYGYLMRPSGGNASIFSTSLPNLNETEWNTYKITVTAPWTSSSAWIMLSYRNVAGDAIKWFEIKDLKLSEGTGYDGFTYSPFEFKYQPYVYPMIDYGGGGFTEAEMWNPNLNKFRWDVYRPAIYVKSYLDAIFRGFEFNGNKYTQLDSSGNPISNYRWDSNLKFDKDFNKLIIPHNEAQLSKSFLASEIPTGGVLFSANLNNGNTVASDVDTEGFRPVKNEAFTPSIVNSNFLSTETVTLNDKLHRTITTKIQYKGKMSIKGKMYITSALPIGERPAIKVVLVKLPNVGSTSFTSSDIIAEATTTRSSNSVGETTEFEVNYEGDFNGRYVLTTIGVGANVVFSGYRWNNVNVTLNVETEGLNAPLLYGDYFSLFDMIPRGISIKDFLKNIMLMFNLYMIVDVEDDTLFHIYTYEDFYDAITDFDKSRALNWTKKVDWESYTINTNIELPKSYEYRYKEDEDYFNQTYKKEFNEVYGEYKLLDSSGLVASKKTEIMFSPTINSDWKMKLDIPAIYETDNFGVADREQIKSNLRILYFNGAVSNSLSGSTIQNYTLVDNNGQTIPNVSDNVFFEYGHSSMVSRDIISYTAGNALDTYVRQTLFFDLPQKFWNRDAGDLNTSVLENLKRLFLYHRYHRAQIRELTDPNIVTVDVEVYLSEADISVLDFRIPIYLQSPYGSAYFKLLKVEYSSSSEPSDVLIQKVVLPDTNLR